MSRTTKQSLRVLLLILAVPLFMGQVCQPQQNTAPVANAGAAQTVASGAGVALNGSASSDADGDTLTYAWTVVSGTVTLVGATTATPTFTAPTTTTTVVLVFQLTVNDGNGGTSSATTTVTVTGSGGGGGGGGGGTTTANLYVADNGGNTVLSWDISTPSNINGNVAPTANLSGLQTLLAGPLDVALDGSGNLLVTNFAASITSYSGATTLSSINGNVAPSRNVTGAATLLATPMCMAINQTTNVLLMMDTGVNQIYSYSSVSGAGFNGNIAPSRIIAGPNVNGAQGLAFGASDTLYVADTGTGSVTVFNNASTLNGAALTANRVITSAAFLGSVWDVFVDGSDNLYVVSPPNQVHVISSASTRSGAISPSVTLTVPGALSVRSIAVDSSGRGYILDAGLPGVYSYDNIATRNGAVAADRTLAGASTQLVGPQRLLLGP